MFGLFKKKVKVVARDIQKFEKKDFMEGVVGMAVMLMWADGSAQDAERQKVQKILEHNPALSNYGPEVQATFQRFDSLFRDVGFLAGRTQVLRELKDLQGDNNEMEDVLVVGVTVATSDGTVDNKEKELLQLVAQGFGLRLENYLLEQ